MYSLNKIFKKAAKSEEGFVFLLALMGIFVLVAIGFLALSTISEELMISSRLVGERKAYSAAETGVYAVCANDTFANITKTAVDPVNDPTVYYSAIDRGANGTVVLPGYPPGYKSTATVFEVTGVDEKYSSRITLQIGVADKPTPADTNY
jgi:hypothetical protein